ncbi:hypothetical protein B0I35DRAFT_433755 [Stachybotrys elegans]|uniref:Uncharacterized protein n=1 Tax=Stachybotrys elegans TaxID=80388 RepID=A0A8K0ST43_9HYPO|nr:hypothetical protein B0I35DRAFT_433755 [Stachybotrys elegans]
MTGHAHLFTIWPWASCLGPCCPGRGNQNIMPILVSFLISHGRPWDSADSEEISCYTKCLAWGTGRISVRQGPSPSRSAHASWTRWAALLS